MSEQLVGLLVPVVATVTALIVRLPKRRRVGIDAQMRKEVLSVKSFAEEFDPGTKERQALDAALSRGVDAYLNGNIWYSAKTHARWRRAERFENGALMVGAAALAITLSMSVAEAASSFDPEPYMHLAYMVLVVAAAFTVLLVVAQRLAFKSMASDVPMVAPTPPAGERAPSR